jgi:S1-C subfamily serine protease
MRKLALVSTFVVALACSCARGESSDATGQSPEVKTGDSYDLVIQKMGVPKSKMASSQLCVLIYDAIKVELISNCVARISEYKPTTPVAPKSIDARRNECIQAIADYHARTEKLESEELELTKLISKLNALIDEAHDIVLANESVAKPRTTIYKYEDEDGDEVRQTQTTPADDGRAALYYKYKSRLLKYIDERDVAQKRITQIDNELAEVALFCQQRQAELGKLGGSIPDMDQATSLGSGFFITKNGYLLTNYHVVDGAKKLSIRHNGKLLPADLIAQDKSTDLALLKVEGTFDFIEIAESPAQLGAAVFTTGYPNPSAQGTEVKYTEGNVSSTSGFQDDARTYQISVPVQPGNSGGPLVTKDGKVVGIIAARLGEIYALETSGSLPQNVNYAIKNTYIKAFLSGVSGLNLEAGESNNGTAIEKTKLATVMVLAY